MEQPLFSVAVTTYRQAHLLRRCLKSVFAQDCGPVELLVCDDHSCDFFAGETEAWIRQNAPDWVSRIRVRQNERYSGPAATAQAALEQAHGRYFIRLCGDEVLCRPDSLAGAARQIGETSAALCLLLPQWQQIGQQAIAAHVLTYGPDRIVSVRGVVWNTAALRNAGGFDVSYLYLAEEPALLRAAAQGFVLQGIRTPLTAQPDRAAPSSQPEQVRLDEAAGQQEQIRAMETIGMPFWKTSGSFRERITARLALQAKEAGVDLILGWRAWSLSQKLAWRLRHGPVLWAWAAAHGRYRRSWILWLAATAASGLGMRAQLPICPGWPDNKIWASVFLLSLLGTVVSGVSCGAASLLRKIVKG